MWNNIFKSEQDKSEQANKLKELTTFNVEELIKLKNILNSKPIENVEVSKLAECVKCHMYGNKENMKLDKKVGKETHNYKNIFWGSLSLSYRENDKVIYEYTCIHCQPKSKTKKKSKKTA